MKIQLLFSTLLLVVITGAVLGQSNSRLDSSKKLTALIFAGKDREAITLMNKLNASDPKRSKSLLEGEVRLYENIGNFTKADEILQKRIGETKKDPKTKRAYQKALDDLSILYEKMGNETGAESILEQLVASEYGNKDSKSNEEALRAYKSKMASYFYPFHNRKEYFAWSVKTARITDSSNRAEYRQLLKNPYTPANAQRLQYYRNLIRTPFDSLKVLRDPDLQRKWQETVVEMKKTDSTYQSMHQLDALLKMSMASEAAYNTASSDEINLLHNGHLKFNGEKNELSDTWEEVQRLFGLYEKDHNYKAAEALIKQAIALDDRMIASGQITANPYAKLYPPKTLKAFVNSPMFKGMGTMLTQSITAHERHGWVDIYYIQNKAFLAKLYLDMGRTPQYRLLADTIYRLCKRFDQSTNPIVLDYLAQTYLRLAKYPDAETAYRKIVAARSTNTAELNLFSRNYLTSLQALSKIYETEGKNDAAASALKQALAYDKAAGRETYPDHMGLVIDLAQLYEDAGRCNLAEQYCSQDMGPILNNVKNNFSFLSEQEKILWLGNQISAFDFAASLLLTDPHPLNDFLVSTCDEQLQLKGIVLNDEQKVLETLRNSGNPQLNQLIKDWENNRSAIARQYSQPPNRYTKRLTDSLSSVANTQEKKINERSSSFQDHRRNQDIDFRQIQGRLSKNEAAIEFVRFNYYHKKWTDTIKYGAFVILPNDGKPHFVSLCNESQLADLLDPKKGSSPLDFYGDSTVNARRDKRSDVLYDRVWSPIEPLLKGIDKIAISPAGLLNRVAFSALPYGAGFLVDRYELRQYNSIREVAENKTVRSHNFTANAVLYGGIDFDATGSAATFDNSAADGKALPIFLKRSLTGGSWGYLSGTLDEVSGIRRLFSTNHINTQVFTGSKATEESLKQLSGHSPAILHLATHGFSLPDVERKSSIISNQQENPFTMADNPMFRSGIIMAGANRVWGGEKPIPGKEDGIVTAYEISTLDFSGTELVTLSACETALGDIRGTEGVFGLQRAFKLAGVKNMLLSLWKVPDAQTSELMEHFYTNKVGGMDNYQALHAAQKQMRKKYPPYFWSSFELIE